MSTLLALASAAVASPAAQKLGTGGASVATGSSLVGMMFGLVLVVALILGLGWVLRRMPGAAQRSSGALRVVASLPIGARERLLVVDVAGEQMVLGVTGQHISLLKSLDTPLPVPEGPGHNFAAVLARRMGGARS